MCLCVFCLLTGIWPCFKDKGAAKPVEKRKTRYVLIVFFFSQGNTHLQTFKTLSRRYGFYRKVRKQPFLSIKV